jgi:hypothetical protein
MFHFCTNVIHAWIIYNINNKQERKMSKFISQRSSIVTLGAMKDGLFSTIIAINGMYIDITHFSKLNMLPNIFWHFANSWTFPFIFIKSISLKNYWCTFKVMIKDKIKWLKPISHAFHNKDLKQKFALLNWYNVPCNEFLMDIRTWFNIKCTMDSVSWP